MLTRVFTNLVLVIQMVSVDFALNLSILLMLIGLLGLFSMSFGFPLLAIFFKLLQSCKRGWSSKEQRRVGDPKRPPPQISISIIIPAHNEGDSIGPTIDSVWKAQSLSQLQGLDIKIQILVAADGCSDETASIASRHGAEVVEQPRNLGKWKTLENLFADTQENVSWICIVDSGVIWPQDLLIKLHQDLRNESLIGICPSYRNPNLSSLEKVAWFIESRIKSLENIAGGPVSVHGATAFYRRDPLQNALQYLSGKAWLNDDVVIPLIIRSLNPQATLRYRTDALITDVSPFVQQREFARRRRLVIGNLQWISNLLFQTARLNQVATCLALRRMCRVFWAYWLMAFLSGLLLLTLTLVSRDSLHLTLFVGLLVVCLAALILHKTRQFQALFIPSLLSPVYLLSRREASWK